MKRREFVLGGVATAVAAQTTKPIRIAFLGGGHGHARAKVALTQRSSDWELVGIYESDPTVMARYEKMGVPALTRAQILEDSSILVVGIEGWVWDLAAYAKAALEAGKHIHLDKPPAANMSDFRAIQDLAARNERLVQVGYMWRYNPAVARMLHLGTSGALGEVFFFRDANDVPAGQSSLLFGTVVGNEITEDLAGNRLIRRQDAEGDRAIRQGSNLVGIEVLERRSNLAYHR